MKKSEPMETIEVDGGSLQMAPPSRHASAWFAKLRRRVSFSFFFFLAWVRVWKPRPTDGDKGRKKRDFKGGKKEIKELCPQMCSSSFSRTMYDTHAVWLHSFFVLYVSPPIWCRTPPRWRRSHKARAVRKKDIDIVYDARVVLSVTHSRSRGLRKAYFLMVYNRRQTGGAPWLSWGRETKKRSFLT